jgi:hypothetical protein
LKRKKENFTHTRPLHYFSREIFYLPYQSGSHDIPQFIPTGVYPLLLIFITIWKLVFPLRQRKPLWQAILKVICAPLHSPTFFHTYVGDVFTSIVKILQDIAWSICWVYAGNFLASEDSDTEDSDKGVKQEWSKTFWYKTVLIPLITMAPLVIRFNQCLRKFWDTVSYLRMMLSNSRWRKEATVFISHDSFFNTLSLIYSMMSRGTDSRIWLMQQNMYLHCWSLFLEYSIHFI